jgi:hypothetical protein
MNERSLAARVPTIEDRDKVTAELCEHFAAGHMELDALEARLAAVDQAESAGELGKLVSDLPALVKAQPATVDRPAARGWALALLGGSSRRGVWAPPRHLHAVAVMGGVELDFRDALLRQGETHVSAVAVMGGIEIIVPPGLPVTVRGLGLLGAVDQVEQTAAELDADAPRLRVTALACMGGVEIKTRPSETSKEIAVKRER